MPKYTPEIERVKAKNLSKAFVKSGLNQTRLAEKEGVTPQAIGQRVRRKPVQDALTRYFDSNKLKKKLRQVAEEGLEANKVIGYLHQYRRTGEGEKVERLQPDEVVSNDYIDVPDYNVRFKFWHDLMAIKGHLKSNGNGKGVNVSTIIFNFRDQSGLFSRTEAEKVSPERG